MDGLPRGQHVEENQYALVNMWQCTSKKKMHKYFLPSVEVFPHYCDWKKYIWYYYFAGFFFCFFCKKFMQKAQVNWLASQKLWINVLTYIWFPACVLGILTPAHTNNSTITAVTTLEMDIKITLDPLCRRGGRHLINGWSVIMHSVW